MAESPTQRLASIALGGDVVTWITARREAPKAPSFQKIANELKAATGGAVEVSDQTIRLWYTHGLEQAEAS